MRTLLKLAIAFIGLFTVSCSSSKYATENDNDDIYYSSKDPKPVIASVQNTNNEAGTEQKQETFEAKKDGNAYITNNYEKDFNYDDYYDYEYAARLRRFHNPSPSYSYYDDYYTNSYWYNNNPNYFGVSIYLGYSWWGPTYNMYSYQPNYFWGCDPFFHPRPYGYYGGYWNGYANGYWNGYQQGQLDNYYFNSFDNNSYHYGPRKTSATNHRTSASRESFGQKYQRAVAEEPRGGREIHSTPGRSMPGPTTTPVITSNPRSSTSPAVEPRSGNHEPVTPVKDISIKDVTPGRPVKEINSRDNEHPVFNEPRSVNGNKDLDIIEPMKNTNSEPRPKAEPRNEIKPIKISDFRDEPKINSQPKNNNVQPNNNVTPRPASPRNNSGNVNSPRRR